MFLVFCKLPSRPFDEIDMTLDQGQNPTGTVKKDVGHFLQL